MTDSQSATRHRGAFALSALVVLVVLAVSIGGPVGAVAGDPAESRTTGIDSQYERIGGAVDDPSSAEASGPAAEFTYEPAEPAVDEEVTFDGSGSSDRDGSIVEYEWDVDGDGDYELLGERTSISYPAAEMVTVSLRVTDDDGNTDTAQRTVAVGGAEEGHLAITDFDVPERAAPGDTVTGTITLENVGETAVVADESDVGYLTLWFQEDSTGDGRHQVLQRNRSTLDESVGEVAPGETVTVERTLDLGADLEPSDYAFRASVGEGVDFDQTDYRPVTIGGEPLKIVGTNAPVRAGEVLEVDVGGENVGEDEVTRTATLSIDGTERDSTTVTLAPGENASATLSWATTDGDGGNYTATVVSGDLSDATTVTVEPADDDGPPSIRVADGVVNVTEGNTATNTGAYSDPGSGTVSLDANVGTVSKRDADAWEWTFDAADGPDDSRTVTITATDENGATGEASFELIVDNAAPSITADLPLVSVSAGETATNTGTFDDDGEDAVDLNASVGTVSKTSDGAWVWALDDADGFATHTVTITAEDDDGDATAVDFDLAVAEESAFEVNRLDANGPVEEGDVLEVDAAVENTGGESGTETVELRGADGDVLDEAPVTLGSGQTTSVTLAYETADGDAGSHDFEVVAGNDSATVTVEVERGATPSLVVSATDERGAPVEGAAVTVLTPGNGEQNTTETDADGVVRFTLESGVYDVVVATDGYETATRSNVTVGGEETAVDVTLAGIDPSAFGVTIDDADSPVAGGGTVAVEASVENTGGESGRETVELRDGDGDVLDEAAVTLGPGQTTTVSLAYDTDDGDAGPHDLEVVAGNDSATVTVEVVTGGFRVDVQRTNSPVVEGGTVAVSAAVENAGLEARTETVELRDGDGEVLDDERVELDAGESTTVTLRWETGDDDGGTYDIAVAAAEDREAASVSVESFSIGFSRQPSSPEPSETVTFGTFFVPDDARLHWDLGDGSTAWGRTVSHQYDSAGTYDVTVTDRRTGGEESFEVEVSWPVFQAVIVEQDVESVEREYGGTPLSGYSWEEEFSVETAGVWDVDYVEYELDGETVVTDSASESATFDLGELDDDSVLTATVVDEDGTEMQATETVRVTPIPDRMEPFFDAADVEVDREAGEIVAAAPLTDAAALVPTGDVPMDVDEIDIEGNPDTVLTYDAQAVGSTLDIEGAIESSTPGMELGVALETEATLDSEFRFDEAAFGADYQAEGFPGPGMNFSLPVVNEVGVGMNFDPRFAAEGVLGDDLVVREGRLQPGTDIDVGATLDIAGCGVGIGVTGGLDVAYDVEPADLTGGEVHTTPSDLDNLGGIVTLGGWAEVFCLGFSTGTELEWTHDFGSGPTLAVTGAGGPLVPNPLLPGPTAFGSPVSGATVQSADWEPRSKGGENPPEGASTGDVERLSDRSFADTQPSIAAAGDDLVVAWSAQNADESVVEGRDLRVRTYETAAGEWSETERLTDDATFDRRPALAATDGATIAAWSTVDATVDEDALDDAAIADLFGEQEISFSIDDGDGWSDPVVLTDTGDRQYRPSVTPLGDGWLVAWTAASASGDAPPAVRYVTIDADGEPGDVQRIPGADLPAVGPADDGATLAYATVGGDTDEVVTLRVDVDGGTTERHRHAAGDVSALSTAGARTVWAAGSAAESRLLEADGRGVEPLELREDVAGVSELDLAARDGTAVLSYRARTAGSDARDLVYRLDRGDGWVYDHPYAGAANLSVWSSDVTVASDGESFHTAYAARPSARDAVDDVFVAGHDFRPAYAVEADAAAAPAGETTTISYELTNVGDVRSSDDVTVTVRDGSRIVARDDRADVDPGETVTGSVEATVGDSGTFDLSVEYEESDGETPLESATVVAATPRLSVGAIDADAVDEDALDADAADVPADRDETADGEITVTAAVRNDGDAAASDVPVVFADGDDVRVSRTVDRVAPGENATVSATIDPAAVDGSSPDRVRIDTGAVDESHVADGEGLTWFVRPDLWVADVTYARTDDGVNAEVVLANRGFGAADATLTVRDRDRDVVLGEADAAVGHARNGAPSFATVEVPLGNVDPGTSVTVLADTAVPDADPSTTGQVDDVGPVLDPDRPLFDVTIADATDAVEVGVPLAVDVTVENRGESADEQTVTLAVDGEPVDEVQVALEPNGTATETLRYERPTDQPSLVDVRVTSAGDADDTRTALEAVEDTGGGTEEKPTATPDDDPSGGPTATPTSGSGDDVGSTPTDPPATTDGDGPGFGAALTVAVVLLAALVVRRRDA